MPRIPKTTKNPHGLSIKEKLVIEDMVHKVSRGKPLTPVESTKKFYDVGSDAVASVITSRNLADQDFREALIEGLQKRKILGRNSRVEEKLEEGLDAVDKDGNIDYKAILAYIQEINKVSGVYAPEKKETKTLKLNVDISQEELDKRIKQLQKELE